jgi:hypothetical protein
MGLFISLATVQCFLPRSLRKTFTINLINKILTIFHKIISSKFSFEYESNGTPSDP